jgi:hypothetical protein
MNVNVLDDRSNALIIFAERLAHEPHKFFSAPERGKTQLAADAAKWFLEGDQNQRQGEPSSDLSPGCCDANRGVARRRPGVGAVKDNQEFDQYLSTARTCHSRDCGMSRSSFTAFGFNVAD